MAGIQALHPSLRDLSTQGQPTSPVLPTGAQLLAGASYPGQLPSCLLGFTENQRGWGEKGTFTELLLYARHLLTPLHGRDWGQEEKGMMEDEMFGWHH